MALTESTMVELGSAAPAFSLPDTVSGSTVSFDSVAGEHGTLVMFICAHCPFVIHVQDELARIGQDYSAKPVGIVAISANDAVTHPQDAPENLKKMAETLGFEFPYCYDESQAVARSYGAACTPDFFLFDGAGKLAYRGQLDAGRQRSPRRPRRGVGRGAGVAGAATERGLQHQVASGERLSQARPAAEAASKPWGAPGRERE